MVYCHNGGLPLHMNPILLPIGLGWSFTILWWLLHCPGSAMTAYLGSSLLLRQYWGRGFPSLFMLRWKQLFENTVTNVTNIYSQKSYSVSWLLSSLTLIHFVCACVCFQLINGCMYSVSFLRLLVKLIVCVFHVKGGCCWRCEETGSSSVATGSCWAKTPLTTTVDRRKELADSARWFLPASAPSSGQTSRHSRRQVRGTDKADW